MTLFDGAAVSQPEPRDGFFPVLLPCGHETLITEARARLGLAIPHVTCAQCQAGPFAVVPVSNDELRAVGSLGPLSPSGMTFIVPAAGTLRERP
jgi:hypothetical protein